MDVDRLSMEEQTEHMSKGLCFNCHKPGHMGKDYPDNGKKNEQEKKMTGRELHAHVRGLIAELQGDDQKDFWNQADDTGF